MNKVKVNVQDNRQGGARPVRLPRTRYPVDESGNKYCPRCQQKKPATEFRLRLKRGKRVHVPTCNACYKATDHGVTGARSRKRVRYTLPVSTEAIEECVILRARQVVELLNMTPYAGKYRLRALVRQGLIRPLGDPRFWFKGGMIPVEFQLKEVRRYLQSTSGTIARRQALRFETPKVGLLHAVCPVCNREQEFDLEARTFPVHWDRTTLIQCAGSNTRVP